ncbi:MAG: hypothetical protein WCA90_00170 [Ilumatobacteraceae bacterium]
MMHNTGIKSGSTDIAPGALSVTGPQPAWMTLDEARERAFTGEIVFEVDPEVLAYLDNGVVYYAERASDTPLGRRLLEAGVVDTGQLERGTVRVGDVEHLGRLFDRDASVDRDAVLVVTETATEALIAELANQAVTTVRVTAYRHHPSGVHRWFVAQLDTVAATGTMASVPQIETVTVDELPELDLAADELTIEWDEFDDGSTDVATLPEVDEFELAMFDPFREGVETETGNGSDREVETASVEFADPSVVDSIDVEVVDAEASEGADPEADDEQADAFVLVGETDGESVDVVPVDVVPVDDDGADFQFEVTWPDGTEELVAAPTDVAASPEGVDTSSDAPAFVETDDGELQFEIPPLELSDDEAAADEVPDDVASAVRRAIAAIESAAGAPVLATVDTPEATVDAASVESAGVPAAAEITTQFAAVEGEAAPQGFAGFAPPTMDMRAEVMYAKMEEEAMAEEAMAESPFDAPPDAVGDQAYSEPMQPSHGVASVVFLDEEPESEPADERSSALRRLIGSLRRKDH